MKQILASRLIKVPKEVKVTIKSRKVVVTGPRGKLSRSFQNTKVDLQVVNNGRGVRCELWFGKRKALAMIRTITSHVENMITGVTRGFQRKMRMVYAHFPISVSCEDGGKRVEIRNFLGEKIVRHVKMNDGVTVTKSSDVKDELVLTGNNVDDVAQSAANIHGKCLVRNKDIRKFLDGVYVSEKCLATAAPEQ
eukprot:CAMPEP_0183350628 /NCGR_PEP_ID=MMETSP0164_2-20130417/20690_1 /TAXON_ID=221442 /ORGANISM="Coccolithus pelagicus ssp braarudi, Strain PLY182g" /LENGTH=192 /DNA_ID=CAMNT_0025522599 /DNA_START=43 /DNA_END=621 /DNA_ORIENTATION=-